MTRNRIGMPGLLQALCALALFVLPNLLSADTPPPNPARFDQEVAAILDREAAHPPAENGILFIGSSNIRKWPINAAFPDLPIINQGFGGSQAPDCLFFFDKLVTPFYPKLIVFHAGGNDLAAGRTPNQIAADVETFVKKVHTELPKTKIIYVGLFPAPSRWELMDKYHETTRLITAFIHRDRKVTFVNPEKPLLSAEGMIRPELYESDRLHLNAQGYEIMTKLIAPYLKKAARQ
jgi:lysophospholipase L1-like esterase